MVDERIDDTDADNTTDHPENPRIIIEAGEQHLNGEQALVFARSRAYVDGDFTRTANQRKLIQALVDKVLALPVTELPGVIQAAAKCVTTDMKVNDIISLAQQFKDDGDLLMYSAMLPSLTGYVDGVSYVFADEDKVTEMMKVVDQGGDPSGITGSTSKLAQKYGAGSSAGGSSTGGPLRVVGCMPAMTTIRAAHPPIAAVTLQVEPALRLTMAAQRAVPRAAMPIRRPAHPVPGQAIPERHPPAVLLARPARAATQQVQEPAAMQREPAWALPTSVFYDLQRDAA